mgnify:CR=1 FL=1
MALTKLLPNFLKLTAGGVGVLSVTMLPNYIQSNNQDYLQPLQIVDTKNAGSLFMNDIKPKLIKTKSILTRKTKEHDFLKSFKFFSKIGNINLIRASSALETKGINFKKDIGLN